MKKVFKHFLRHKYVLLLIIALLAVQATCDLTLPSYTAVIVNTGIARSGIEIAAPLHLRPESYDRLVTLTKLTGTEAGVNFVKGAYTPKDGLYEYSHITDANGRVIKHEDTPRLTTLAEYLKIPMLFALDVSAHPEIVEQAQSALASTGAQTDVLDTKELAELKSVADALSDPARAATVNLPAAKARFTAFAQSLTSLLPEQVMAQIDITYIRDEYTAQGIDLGKMQNGYVTHKGVFMLLFALLSCATTLTVTFLSARMGAGFGHDLRNDMFRTVLSFSGREYNKFSTASLITRCTNDIQQVQFVFVMVIRMSIYSPIMAVSAFLKVLKNDFELSWIIGVAVGAVLIIIGTLFALAMPKFKMVQKLIDSLNRISREILDGLPVIRAFARESHEEQRFNAANTDLYNTNLFTSRLMSTMMPLMLFLMNGVGVLIIWTGAKQVEAGTTQVGNLMAFMTYAVQIIVSFMMLSMMSVILPRSLISLGRVGDVLETKSSILDPDIAVTPHPAYNQNAGKLVFSHVNFKYDGADENALEDITFTCEQGTTTAIIGSTGSGKSTLVNLIPRFFDVTGGNIQLGGADLRDLPQEYLRDRIGYVPQRAILFSGTIESNIKFADGVTTEQMHAAASVAQAEEFINSDPDGYKRSISQGGTNVSGGQKQRLSIARAIAKNPDVYIFDDSFSALDFKTDVTLRAKLREHIAKNNPAASVLVVAQRISTVLRADNIIVLEDGKIAGQGTHAQLMKTCEVYRQIALSQLTEKQLAENTVSGVPA